jgi:hypothetical protein
MGCASRSSVSGDPRPVRCTHPRWSASAKARLARLASSAARCRLPRSPRMARLDQRELTTPARCRASVCCRRIASVKASSPGTLRFCPVSTKPRRQRPSTSAGFWFRNEPPPNNLISRRCSDLVNSSQSGVSGILVHPCESLRRSRFGPWR